MALLGQSDSGDRLLEAMYTKFAESFSAKQGLGKEGPLLILTGPGGFPVATGPAKEPDGLAAILDKIPVPSRQWLDSGRRCSEVYGRILQFSEVTDRTDMKERNRFLTARNALYDRKRPGQPTAKYAAYLRYESEYWETRDAISARCCERGVNSKPTQAEADTLAAAEHVWSQMGYREEIDNAFAVLRAVYANDVKTHFTELRAEFAVTAGSKPPVALDPPMADWDSEHGWIAWKWQPADLSWGGADGPARDAGALPAVAGAGVTAQAAAASFTVKIKRVHVARPWLDMGVFSSRSWRYLSGSDLTTVSTGNLADRDPGVMPLIITGFLLAKELSIQIPAAPAGTPAANLGPFALAGGRGGSESKGGFSTSGDGLQIIAFLCERIPKSPFPDPALFR
jgi:hypothetical protein